LLNENFPIVVEDDIAGDHLGNACRALAYSLLWPDAQEKVIHIDGFLQRF
jgi:hypothetical protein